MAKLSKRTRGLEERAPLSSSLGVNIVLCTGLDLNFAICGIQLISPVTNVLYTLFPSPFTPTTTPPTSASTAPIPLPARDQICKGKAAKGPSATRGGGSVKAIALERLQRVVVS